MLTLKQKGVLEAFREHAPAIADHMIANLQSPWWTSILDNSLSNEQIAAEIRNADPEQRLLSYTYAATLELALMRLTSEQLPDPESLSATCPASDTDEWYRVLGHYGFTLNIGPHSATVTRGAGEEYVFLLGLHLILSLRELQPEKTERWKTWSLRSSKHWAISSTWLK